LSSTGQLVQLQFDIPGFCQGVQILEAGTVANGVFYPAKSEGDGVTFDIAPLGATGISEVRTIFNGPVGAACDIPVFGRATR
jgi:hypothetical protein